MKNTFRLLITVSILTGLLSLGLVTASAQESSGIVHITQIGETLSDIALQYGTTVEALSVLNDVPYPYWIYYHQEIIIPATGGPITATTTAVTTGTTAAVTASTTTHTVQDGENLFRIGLNYGWDVETMASVNGLVYPYTIYTGQVLIVPRQSLTHVVQDGETLGSLAVLYGTTETAIIAANDITDANLIYVGQTLDIP